MFMPTRRRSPSFRPALDVLEDRTVPTTLVALESVQLSSGNQQHLFVFDSATPNAIYSRIPVSGLVSGEALQSISFRPATGALYALGKGNYFESGGQQDATAHLYTLDPGTGAATLVGPPAGFTLPYYDRDSMDFDPVRDQIRVIDSFGDNLRLDPATGAVLARDPSFTNQGFYLTGIAYDRPASGGQAATLYGVEDFTSSLSGLNKSLAVVLAESGQASTVGPLTLQFDVVNQFPGRGTSEFMGVNGFDIAADTGTGYVAATSVLMYLGSPGVGSSTNTNLYTVNLTTGATAPVGKIGDGAVSIVSLAAVPPPPTPGGSGGGSSLPANLTANQRYVSDVFVALLGRNPDQTSLTAFAGLLDAGLGRLPFVQAVQQSPEYYLHTVDNLYREVLGRAADPGGLQAGALFLAAGGSAAELKALLYGSPEYYQKAGGTDAGFLAALFSDVTGQSLDGATENVLTGLLGAGVSRAGLALTLLRTPAAGIDQARRFFADFLGRPPGAVEAAAHGGVILGAGAELDLALILASDEFFNAR